MFHHNCPCADIFAIQVLGVLLIYRYEKLEQQQVLDHFPWSRF